MNQRLTEVVYVECEGCGEISNDLTNCTCLYDDEHDIWWCLCPSLEHTLKLLQSFMYAAKTDYKVRAIGKPLTKKLDTPIIPVVED